MAYASPSDGTESQMRSPFDATYHEEMVAVLLLGRLVLCGVFLLAGLSKLRDPGGSRRSLIDFGLAPVLAKPFSILLPLCEVIVAIGLLLASFAWISAVGALALLLLFILAIAITLARGRKPDCHCFGQLHSKPIGWDLVSRNGALAIIAALVIRAGPRQPGFGAFISTSIQNSGSPLPLILLLAALALLVFQSWLIFQLIQQGGRVLLRLDALEKHMGGNAAQPPPAPPGLLVGETAPEFELEDLESRPVSLQELRSSGKPVLLLFTHPGCGPCTALLPEAAALQRDAATHFRLVLLSQGSKDENSKTKELGLHTVLLQREHEISDRYQALGTPSAVLIRQDGAIGSAVVTGPEAIRSLVSNTINESVAGLLATHLQEGENVPPLVFPDLEGRMFNLSQLHGKPAILLFWSPQCGFCQQMTEDLKIWEKKASKAGTQVILLSSGAVEANAKQGFRSRILLDQNFSAGKAFGATGTPSALLLDEQCKIASKIAVGKQDILGSIFNAQIGVPR